MLNRRYEEDRDNRKLSHHENYLKVWNDNADWFKQKRCKLNHFTNLNYITNLGQSKNDMSLMTRVDSFVEKSNKLKLLGIAMQSENHLGSNEFYWSLRNSTKNGSKKILERDDRVNFIKSGYGPTERIIYERKMPEVVPETVAKVNKFKMRNGSVAHTELLIKTFSDFPAVRSIMKTSNSRVLRA